MGEIRSIHDRFDRDPTALELLRTSGLPRHYNGPACYVHTNPDTIHPPTGSLIIGPMNHASDVSLMFLWEMVEPSHVLRVELYKTTDPDWSFDNRADDPATWRPMLPDLDPAFSDWIVAPDTPARENRMTLSFYLLRAEAFAFRLTTTPAGARLTARVWGLLCGYRVG